MPRRIQKNEHKPLETCALNDVTDSALSAKSALFERRGCTSRAAYWNSRYSIVNRSSSLFLVFVFAFALLFLQSELHRRSGHGVVQIEKHFVNEKTICDHLLSLGTLFDNTSGNRVDRPSETRLLSGHNPLYALAPSQKNTLH